MPLAFSASIHELAPESSTLSARAGDAASTSPAGGDGGAETCETGVVPTLPLIPLIELMVTPHLRTWPDSRAPGLFLTTSYRRPLLGHDTSLNFQLTPSEQNSCERSNAPRSLFLLGQRLIIPPAKLSIRLRTASLPPEG